MTDLLTTLGALVVLVGGLFLFAASFGMVENPWDALVRGVSSRLPDPTTPDPTTRQGAQPMPEPDDDPETPASAEPAPEATDDHAARKRKTRDDYFISTEGMPPGFAKINFDYGGSYEQQFGKRTAPERDERDGGTEREDPPPG